jgi:hypothetical protein
MASKLSRENEFHVCTPRSVSFCRDVADESHMFDAIIGPGMGSTTQAKGNMNVAAQVAHSKLVLEDVRRYGGLLVHSTLPPSIHGHQII